MRRHLDNLGIDSDRILPLDVAGEIMLGDFAVTATPAWHSDPDAIGVILRVENALIYLTADTVLAPELIPQVQARLERPPDLLFTCINGRLGNMNAEDAVCLAKALVPGLSIPMHYGMFAENTADPVPFVDGCTLAGLSAKTLEVGKPNLFSQNTTITNFK